MTIFFFQAEDGIRDYKVTGVQTCALPISYWRVTVMTGGGISRLQVLAQVADVEQRQPTLGRDEDDQVARALHVVQHLDPLLGERLGQIGRASCRERV